MRTITLLNPKGGCGKTTLATSLASFLAASGQTTALYDHDWQASSTRWLERRPNHLPRVLGLAAFRLDQGQTKTWQMRVPRDTRWAVTDTAAALRRPQLDDLVAKADRIIIPVIPSPIDIDALASFVAQLRTIARVRAGAVPVGVVINRIFPGCGFVPRVEGALDAMGLPVVARLRESAGYAEAGAAGKGIHEMSGESAFDEQEEWVPIIRWLAEGVEPDAKRRMIPAIPATVSV